MKGFAGAGRGAEEETACPPRKGRLRGSFEGSVRFRLQEFRVWVLGLRAWAGLRVQSFRVKTIGATGRQHTPTAGDRRATKRVRMGAVTN